MWARRGSLLMLTLLVSAMGAAVAVNGVNPAAYGAAEQFRMTRADAIDTSRSQARALLSSANGLTVDGDWLADDGDGLDAAHATLSDSENRVDSTANRDELSALVGEADGDSMPGDWSDMTGMADRLDAERGEVETDVQAYEARIAAEQAAAVHAAAVQAAYGAGSAASYGSWGDPYYSSDSGAWLQTCNGNGNHLVGITPVG